MVFDKLFYFMFSCFGSNEAGVTKILFEGSVEAKFAEPGVSHYVTTQDMYLYLVAKGSLGHDPLLKKFGLEPKPLLGAPAESEQVKALLTAICSANTRIVGWSAPHDQNEIALCPGALSTYLRLEGKYRYWSEGDRQAVKKLSESFAKERFNLVSQSELARNLVFGSALGELVFFFRFLRKSVTVLVPTNFGLPGATKSL